MATTPPNPSKHVLQERRDSCTQTDAITSARIDDHETAPTPRKDVDAADSAPASRTDEPGTRRHRRAQRLTAPTELAFLGDVAYAVLVDAVVERAAAEEELRVEDVDAIVRNVVARGPRDRPEEGAWSGEDLYYLWMGVMIVGICVLVRG